MSVRVEARIPDILRRLEGRLRDPRPFLEEVGVRLAENARRRILRGTQPGGAPMAPLSPLTVQVKRGSQVLRDTGALLKSITARVEGPRSVTVGTNLVYARVHQEGAVIRPRRRYLLVPLHWTARQVARGAGPGRFGGSVRNVGLFFYRSKRTGSAFLARAVGTGKGRRLELWYALRQAVRIPARPFLPKDLSSPEDRQAVARALRVWLEGGA
jgi:phage gpG-like protein